MKTNIDHLPLSRQKHLEHIVYILRDEVEQATQLSIGKKKHSRILKIILFGSHATGKWVNDPAHGYISDYDILVIMNNGDLLQNHRIWNSAEERISLNIKIPLNILIHSLEEVNNALSQGQYFFSDIKEQGIELYSSGSKLLAEPSDLSLTERKAIAEKDYKKWYIGANQFLEFCEIAIQKQYYNKAAFELHQATERYYACLLLVLTHYKPNTHNLVQLNALSIEQTPSIAEVFPQDTKFQSRCFQLLKKAYIDARYSDHYEITQEELEWLKQRVEQLKVITARICQEKIDSL